MQNTVELFIVALTMVYEFRVILIDLQIPKAREYFLPCYLFTLCVRIEFIPFSKRIRGKENVTVYILADYTVQKEIPLINNGLKIYRIIFSPWLIQKVCRQDTSLASGMLNQNREYPMSTRIKSVSWFLFIANSLKKCCSLYCEIILYKL